MCIRLLWKEKLPKQVFSVLWGIVLFKCLVPVSLPSLWKGSGRGTLEIGTMQAIQIPAGIFINEKPTGFHLGELLFVVWLLVTCILLLYFICSYLRCIREFRTALPAPDTRFLREWREGSLCKRIG